MSETKIEVLTVPDERIRLENWRANSLPKGTLYLKIGNRAPVIVEPDEKPALLAALLEDAGAVKVEMTYDGYLEHAGQRHAFFTEGIHVGPHYVVPIPPEGTTK